MKTLFKILALTALIVGLQTATFAQTATVRTTLSAAITASQTTATVTSTSGVATPLSDAPQWMFIENELVRISAISGTTLTIVRGQNGTASPTGGHRSGTLVWIGPTINFITTDPYGTCTRGAEIYLPKINVRNGKAWDCILSSTNTTNQWTAVNYQQLGNARPYKKLPVTAITYTLLPTDDIVGYNSNVAGTITIPALTGAYGKTYTIQQEVSAAVSITLTPSAGQLINGATTITFPNQNGALYGGVTIYTDGLNWFASKGY